jgi:hypothetical protein
MSKIMEWISVKDELPKDGELVGVYRPNAHEQADPIVCERVHFGNGWFDGIEENIVTHWMRLPKE